MCIVSNSVLVGPLIHTIRLIPLLSVNQRNKPTVPGQAVSGSMFLRSYAALCTPEMYLQN